LNNLQERQPIEIQLDDRFVSDLELNEHICAADLVLTLYERSYGSSSIVIRAATSARPVIATNQGLVGYLVREHRLGAVVNVCDIAAVADSLRSFISTGRVAGFDAHAARLYAASCAPSTFAHRLLLLDDCDLKVRNVAPTCNGAVAWKGVRAGDNGERGGGDE
jgi:hypothetical protein